MKKITILALYICLLLPMSANAQTGEWFKDQDVSARLIAGSENNAALEIELADGWHTYWRIPGEAGLPPMFSWSDSENIRDVEVFWPAPTRKKEYEFYTFGFSEKLTLPLNLTHKEEGKSGTLDLKAQIMICKDICIPQKFELNLPLKEGEHSKENEIITAAKTKIPQETPIEGLSIDSMVAAKDTLVVSVTSENGFENMDVFPVIEEDFMGLASPPEIEISVHDPQKAMIKIAAPLDYKDGEMENLASKLQEKTLSVTLKHGDQSIVSKVQY